MPDHFLDGLQVNLGLAAAGDAVEKKRVETALPHRLLQRRPDTELIRIERNARLGVKRFFIRLGPFHALPGPPCEAFLNEGIQHAGPTRRQAGESPHFHGLARLPEPRQSRHLLGGETGRRLPQLSLGHCFQEGGHTRPRLLLGSRRDDGIKDLAPTAQIIVRHPSRQSQ